MIRSVSALNQLDSTRLDASSPKPPVANDPQKSAFKETFQQFVGESLFGQMLKSMRNSVPKSAYFHGGRGEEIFQQQLDQVVAEKMSRTSADAFSGPMLELFQLQRR